MIKSISLLRVTALSVIMLTISFVIYLDFERVNSDFFVLKKKLADIRLKSVFQGQQFIVKFKGTQVIFIHRNTNEVIDSIIIRTLKSINYDTTLGKDMIVFNNGVTDSYNIRVHGGEIIMQSLLGFEKSIHVNCAGLVREGRYPEG